MLILTECCFSSDLIDKILRNSEGFNISRSFFLLPDSHVALFRQLHDIFCSPSFRVMIGDLFVLHECSDSPFSRFRSMKSALQWATFLSVVKCSRNVAYSLSGNGTQFIFSKILVVSVNAIRPMAQRIISFTSCSNCLRYRGSDSRVFVIVDWADVLCHIRVLHKVPKTKTFISEKGLHISFCSFEKEKKFRRLKNTSFSFFSALITSSIFSVKYPFLVERLNL